MPLIEHQDRKAWFMQIAEWQHEAKSRDIMGQDDDMVHVPFVLSEIQRQAGSENVTVVTDVGQHQMWTAQYYRHNRPRSHITSGGLGTMGFALPAAIGAKFAVPDAEVWVIAGDGGFQMTMPELATIAQEKIKVNVAIINNGFLGMVRQWQEFFYERRYAATPMLSPDFCKLAEAFGHKALRVTERSQVRGAVEQARAELGAVVIDFRVEQEDAVFPMVPAGADLHAMIRRPLPGPLPVSVLAETAETEN